MRARRLELELSLEELAKRARISRTTAGEIEGSARDVRLETLGRIALALHERPSRLCSEHVR